MNKKSAKISIIITACILANVVHSAHELDGRNLDRGKALYAENCASCHGVKLEGQPNWRSPDENGVLPAPPHDESGHTWHHDNQLLFNYTKYGGQAALTERGLTGMTSGMPAAKGILSDDEIWDVLAFIRSTWSDRVKAIQATRNPPHN